MDAGCNNHRQTINQTTWTLLRLDFVIWSRMRNVNHTRNFTAKIKVKNWKENWKFNPRACANCKRIYPVHTTNSCMIWHAKILTILTFGAFLQWAQTYGEKLYFRTCKNGRRPIRTKSFSVPLRHRLDWKVHNVDRPNSFYCYCPHKFLPLFALNLFYYNRSLLLGKIH